MVRESHLLLKYFKMIILMASSAVNIQLQGSNENLRFRINTGSRSRRRKSIYFENLRSKIFSQQIDRYKMDLDEPKGL